MAQLDDRSAAFILRVWREPGCASTAVWRGSIEHVASGRRAYFVELFAVAAFLEPYIENLCGDDLAQE